MRDRLQVLIVLLVAVLVVDVATAAYGVLRGPFPVAVTLGAPTAYLNLYVHVPLAMTSYLVFGVALVSGILYLWRRDERYDRLTYSAVIVGEIYGVFTIVTGMAWASESWGAAWNWDPRETGVLLLVLVYLGYFAVRQSIPDPERRRLVSNAYAVAAFSMVPLSFAAPLIFKSLHPSFKQARSFMWTGSTALLMGARILLAFATGLLLVALNYLCRSSGCPGRPLQAAAVVLAVWGIIFATLLASPYLSSSPVRVVNAGLDGDAITWVKLSNGTTITLSPPQESPVKPARTPGGEPSILGHIVVVKNGRLVIVRHWSAAFNYAAYTLLLASALLAAAHVGRR